MYTIRDLNEEEVPLLRALLEELADYHNRVASSFAGAYPTMPIDLHIRHMRDHVRERTACIVGLFAEGGGLGGFGMASAESGYGEIDYLYIGEDLRGRGYGNDLMERLLAYLKERGAELVDIKVVLGNPARRFYQKYGFTLRSEVISKRI